MLRQKALLEVAAVTRGSSYGIVCGALLSQQNKGSGCPKASFSLWSRGLGCFFFPSIPASIPAHQYPYLPSLGSMQHGGALIPVKWGFSISMGPPEHSSCLWRAVTILPTPGQLQGGPRCVSRPHQGPLDIPKVVQSSAQHLDCG